MRPLRRIHAVLQSVLRAAILPPLTCGAVAIVASINHARRPNMSASRTITIEAINKVDLPQSWGFFGCGSFFLYEGSAGEGSSEKSRLAGVVCTAAVEQPNFALPLIATCSGNRS